MDVSLRRKHGVGVSTPPPLDNRDIVARFRQDQARATARHTLIYVVLNASPLLLPLAVRTAVEEYHKAYK